MGALISHMIETRKLQKATVDTSPRLEKLAGQKYVRVESVYDGDTFTVFMIQDGRTVRRRCRCIGYDSPEMKGDTKEKAIEAREHLKKVLPAGVFLVEYNGFDKYGRLLVSFRVNGTTLADEMITMGHGYAYNGGTKLSSRIPQIP